MGCHFYTSTHRDEHAKTHLAAVGELEFDRIHFDSKRPAHRIKASKADIARFYRDTLKDMQRLRDAGVSGRLNFDGWVP
jgi:hypothetical protein